MDLSEYAQKFPAARGKTCFVCGLEQREEIDKGLRADMSAAVLVRWLRNDQGLAKMTFGRLQHHIASGHHQ